MTKDLTSTKQVEFCALRTTRITVCEAIQDIHVATLD